VSSNIEKFVGIVKVDQSGIWFYDGDVDNPVWRQYLIPWHAIDSVVLHQAS